MNDVQRQPIQAEDYAGFTADDFSRMLDAGAFSDMPGKIELVDGVITRMSPAQNPHFFYKRQLLRALDAIFGDGLNGIIAGTEPSFQLSKKSVREPDVALLRDAGSAKGWIPGDHLLLGINVAYTTLTDDKGPKRLSYACGGVPHYWVVDIRGRVVETWSDPADGDYRQHRTIAFGEPIPVPGTDETITLS
jgi:Uma2 family endonuclease